MGFFSLLLQILFCKILPGDDKGEHFLSANNMKTFKLEEVNFVLASNLLTSTLVLTMNSPSFLDLNTAGCYG